ncbi:MAG TPA: hydrogenase maturation protease [Ilumatobacteraceae bacterium]
MSTPVSEETIVRVDRFASARLVADTVLYEGYVLYPYRASAQKNQLRWQFGVLTPREYAISSGGERWSMRSEVLVEPREQPRLIVRIRCLQLQRRQIEATTDGGASYFPADSLDVDGMKIVPWDEAIDQEIDVAETGIADLLHADCPACLEHHFTLADTDEIEVLRDHRGDIAGRAVRRREAVSGLVRISAETAAEGLLKVSVTVENTTEWSDRGSGADRDTAMRRSLIAVHTLLAVDDGSFVSLLEPPPSAEAAVAGCVNDGTFPVMIGSATTRDVMLSSPIILYDFPAVAPESAGDFCDSTEIDEILALRVMTLTDDEKAQARGTDPRAAAIVDRCDDMPDEIWSRLHGAVRSLRPIASDDSHTEATETTVPWWDPGTDSSFDPFNDTMRIGGVEVGSGTRVRLKPSRRADAHDLFYADKIATVKGVFNDVDGDQHVAVALDDDPASDMFEWQGRYLYFHPDEIEVLAPAKSLRVLVAGIGNIFLGDDGFGVEVVKYIDIDELPANVRDGTTVSDFGIRGVHLAYELLDGYDALVLVDAMPLAEQPGTVVVFEPDIDAISATGMDAHSMSPATVLGHLAGLGGSVPRVFIVGCQPSSVEEGIGLSDAVAAAVLPAAETVRQLLVQMYSTAEKDQQQ